ncbi:CLUMA_CG016711, isoform A [Clunio marinus]|uniref:CLUMA_CG016711, isoform A n=1 Tax=Clunio marinus TaxID=568069 RepID=A0A1J1IU24_9DIPT|nr:CLUMA_CG016711, isoform A [Clunio marinus]
MPLNDGSVDEVDINKMKKKTDENKKEKNEINKILFSSDMLFVNFLFCVHLTTFCELNFVGHNKKLVRVVRFA